VTRHVQCLRTENAEDWSATTDRVKRVIKKKKGGGGPRTRKKKINGIRPGKAHDSRRGVQSELWDIVIPKE